MSETFTDAEARDILQSMRHAAGSIFRALDLDGDGVITAEDVAEATARLQALDADGDGQLHEDEFGGPTWLPGFVRQSALVRLLDADGDLVITADDMADAPNRLQPLLARNGSIAANDDLAPPNPRFASYFGGPANTVALFDQLHRYLPADAGPIMPGDDDRQDQSPRMVYEAANAGDVQIGFRNFLVSATGEQLHEWPQDRHVPEGTTAQILDSGLMLRSSCPGNWMATASFPVGAHGTIELVESDGTVAWEFTLFEPGVRVLHHDIEPLPSGNILATVYESMSFTEAEAIGWVPQPTDTLLRPPPLRKLWTEKIIEIEPNLATGGAEIVWQWDSRDHLIQDVDSAKPNFGEITPACRKLDLNYTQYQHFFFCMGQIFHVNALSYDAEHDQILLGSAMHEEIWVIDHGLSTEETRGAGGDVLYRFGNPAAHRAGPYESKTLYWQHDPHWLGDDNAGTGDVLIFNNGARRSADGSPNLDETAMGFGEAYTELLEVALPRGDDGSFTWQPDDPMNGAEITWSFNRDNDRELFSPFMSSARRMPNGNTLIAQGYDKRIREITPEGETVLDYRLGGPGRIYRVLPYRPETVRALLSQSWQQLV